MKPDPDLERRQDEWVARQLENAPPLTLEAQQLLKSLFRDEPNPEPRARTKGVA